MSDPPKQTRVSQSLGNKRMWSSRTGIISMLVLLGALLLLFSSVLLFSLSQISSKKLGISTPSSAHRASKTARNPTATVTSDTDETSTPTPPVYSPQYTQLPPLQLPANQNVIYEQQNNLSMVSTNGGQPQTIVQQGYSYSQAVRPLLMPSGQILYSYNGLWVTDIFGGTPIRIADLAPNEVITSLALSNDGSTIAWSTEPVDGKGVIDIHAGPLAAPAIVYEQQALQCPCFRIFSFMNGTGSKGDSTLLLTDDQGSHEAVQFGLWSLDLTRIFKELQTPQPTPSIPAYATPVPILDENPEQGPLALAYTGSSLLYSSSEGSVPIPTDFSVPEDIGSLSYPNSLEMATLSGSPLFLRTAKVILPEQHNLNNTSDYHWVTTPLFSPDGHTLIYVEFSSDAQDPFDRHSAIFTVQVTGSGTHLHVGTPQLLATSTAKLLELGTWLNDSILTFYSDNNLYALDIKTGAVATLLQTDAYARIVAVVPGPGA